MVGISWGVERMAGHDSFWRWRIPFITRGAFNLDRDAGYIRILGIEYTYGQTVRGWAKKRTLNMWNIVSFLHEDISGGEKAVHPGLRIRFCKIKVSSLFQGSGSH